LRGHRRGGTWDYQKQNAPEPYELRRDRFAGTGGMRVREFHRGAGEVIDVDGQPAAVYRGLDSKIHVRSAVCTHMGCYVHWNDGERTWDCPCHGSRFGIDGDVIAGPAESPLAEITPKKDDKKKTVDSR
jgi:Rieske Fe-S protein